MSAYRIDELVERLGGELVGDGSVQVCRVAPLEEAGEGDIAFLANRKYLAGLKTSRAAAFIVAPTARDVMSDRPRIVTADPYLYFAHLSQLFHPRLPPVAGIHPSASVRAVLPTTVAVNAGAVVEAGVELGDEVMIGAGSYIGAGVKIGRGTYIAPRVTIYANCVIGDNCIVHSGVVIGADGFGFAREAAGSWVKIPQIGRVVIGNDVEIGANTTIDRGAMGDTVLGNGVKLDNQIQIAHNVHVGDHTVMAACAGVAGSAHIGARCMIGGQAGISGHITIADDVVISAWTLVAKSIRKPGVYTSSVLAQEHGAWAKNFSHLRHLDALADRIRVLEQQLKKEEQH
ncbi:UDP-3-O-acylglucosamine N-acyltransferase [Betaproteobacteria bacterium]|nr:UDP-3-O-acylglucosamine N-acyltransferase [Betaproteobacteria bacterium]GHT99422.1 UDP-3-O-acylglucosamine N-acyltransferase [Betaproteobacteria bacterium]